MFLQGVVFVSVLLAAGAAAKEVDNEFINEVSSLLEECDSKYIMVCMKERALRYVEQLPSNLELGGGLIITENEGVKRSARYFGPTSLPTEPRAREEVLDTVLMNRIVNYLRSHTFKFKVPENALQELGRSMEDEPETKEGVVEGRKKKKKRGNMGLLLLLQMKAAAVGAIMLKLIGLVAFKALILGKMSLLLTSIIALKKLLDHKHTSSYEVIAAHPHEEHHHDRSFTASHLAYKGYLDGQNNNN